MTSTRFLHTSDWQLGMTRHYLEGEAQSRYTGDRVETIRRIGELARERGCAFVVVAGDVFEHANLSRRDVGRALDAMGSVGLPVYLLPGNHDPLGPGSLWGRQDYRDLAPANVVLLDERGPHPVVDGVELVAAPWRSKRPDTDPVAPALEGLEADGTLRIVVGHGMLDELDPDRTSLTTVRRAPLDEALARGAVHYVALGDRHIRWPEDGHGAIHYSGTHESTGFREPGRGHVLEVDLDDDGPRVTAHPVGQWEHRVLTRHLDGAEDVEALRAELAALTPKERIVLKTVFTGTLNLSEAAALEALLEQQAEVFASLNAWERHTDLVVVPDEHEFEDLDVGGYAADAVAELRATAASDAEEAPTAGDALRLLYRLVGGAAR
ncbi:DNA double-strand break repair protein Mre11 [Kocuria flava]|uniref:Nuclease SbcCD subunit D n=1 Tax=Kocuria flava TaxID=446860 RepID=A0A2N4SZ98_9MICC|nr:exonuclease SbcCD subunit D [Kocuria flava]PLC11305.1 DNA double-strand break repair protein Mre11 [Kocuria flava]